MAYQRPAFNAPTKPVAVQPAKAVAPAAQPAAQPAAAPRKSGSMPSHDLVLVEARVDEQTGRKTYEVVKGEDGKSVRLGAIWIEEGKNVHLGKLKLPDGTEAYFKAFSTASPSARSGAQK